MLANSQALPEGAGFFPEVVSIISGVACCISLFADWGDNPVGIAFEQLRKLIAALVTVATALALIESVGLFLVAFLAHLIISTILDNRRFGWRRLVVGSLISATFVAVLITFFLVFLRVPLPIGPADWWYNI